MVDCKSTVKSHVHVLADQGGTCAASRLYAYANSRRRLFWVFCLIITLAIFVRVSETLDEVASTGLPDKLTFEPRTEVPYAQRINV